MRRGQHAVDGPLLRELVLEEEGLLVERGAPSAAAEDVLEREVAGEDEEVRVCVGTDGAAGTVRQDFGANERDLAVWERDGARVGPPVEDVGVGSWGCVV